AGASRSQRGWASSGQGGAGVGQPGKARRRSAPVRGGPSRSGSDQGGAAGGGGEFRQIAVGGQSACPTAVRRASCRGPRAGEIGRRAEWLGNQVRPRVRAGSVGR